MEKRLREGEKERKSLGGTDPPNRDLACQLQNCETEMTMF